MYTYIFLICVMDRNNAVGRKHAPPVLFISFFLLSDFYVTSATLYAVS